MDNKKFLDYNGLLYFYSLLNSKFLKTETDPTVPAWAKAQTKPTYTYSEVGAAPAAVIKYSQEGGLEIKPYVYISNDGTVSLTNENGHATYMSYFFPTAVSTGGNTKRVSIAGTDSPTFYGTPTAPTASAGTNTTLIATTAFVTTAVSNAISGVTQISYNVIGANEDLPVTGTTGVIYLKPKTGSTGDGYDEYIWINNTYELIGHKVLDLSTYWDETHLVAITNTEIVNIVYPYQNTPGLSDTAQIRALMLQWLNNYDAINDTSHTITCNVYFSSGDDVYMVTISPSISGTSGSSEILYSSVTGEVSPYTGLG